MSHRITNVIDWLMEQSLSLDVRDSSASLEGAKPESKRSYAIINNCSGHVVINGVKIDAYEKARCGDQIKVIKM